MLLSLMGPAAAARMADLDLIDDASNLSKAEWDGADYVNLDDYLQKSHVESMVRYYKMKCCCDNYGTRTSHKIKSVLNHQKAKERTGRCTLLARVDYAHLKGGKYDNVKCKDHQPGWAALPLASAANAKQSCKVDKSELKDVYEKYGYPDRYCLAEDHPVQGGHLEPEEVKSKRDNFQLKCDPDHEADSPSISTRYGSPTECEIHPVQPAMCVPHGLLEYFGTPALKHFWSTLENDKKQQALKYWREEPREQWDDFAAGFVKDNIWFDQDEFNRKEREYQQRVQKGELVARFRDHI